MVRKLTLAEVQQAVDEAYENVKSIKDGAVDPRMEGVDDKAFGITVALTDGRTINKADTEIMFPLGGISEVPVAVTLLSQNSPDELAHKSKCCGCKCGAGKQKPQVPNCLHGLRAISAVLPTGDPEGKYNMILNQLLNMGGVQPTLNEKLYKELSRQTADENVVEKLTEADFVLYDDTKQSLDIQNRLISLQLNTKGLAAVGATLAADGFNATTGTYAFDGKISAPAVALMAAGGKCKRGWLVRTGLPAKKSFAGAILAVLPGFGAIAVYAPDVDAKGYSVKGAKAIEYIANKLGLNVFASARVEVEK